MKKIMIINGPNLNFLGIRERVSMEMMTMKVFAVI